MLSLVDNIRVFDSSEDVIIHASSHYCPHQDTPHNRRIYEENEAIEDVMLDHPHLSRMMMLHEGDSNETMHYNTERNVSSRMNEKLLECSNCSSKPMELVFVSSGEIRSRKERLLDMKMSLQAASQEQLMKKSHDDMVLRLRGYAVHEENNKLNDRFETKCKTQDATEKKRKDEMTMSRMQQLEYEGDYQQQKQFDMLPLSLSKRTNLVLSDDGKVSLNENTESVTVTDCKENGKQENDRVGSQEEELQVKQTASNREEQVRSNDRAVAKVAGDGVKKTATCSLTLDHLEREKNDDVLGQAIIDRDYSVRHTKTAIHNKEAPSHEDTSYEARKSPASLEQVAQMYPSNDVPARQTNTKRSPKMEVTHLVSDEIAPNPKNRVGTRREDNMVCRLQAALHKEKQQVLEKTARLLNEQSINQQLRDKVEMLEAHFAAEDSKLNSKMRRAARRHSQDIQLLGKEQDDRVNELKEQVCQQKAAIDRLTRDKIQLKVALKQLQKTETKLSSDQHYDTMDVVGLQAELDDMNHRIHDYLAKVKRWKSNSKEKMQNCDDKATDLVGLLEKVWLDFPQFSEARQRPRTESSGLASGPQQHSIGGVDVQLHVVRFLKKRLRQREEELRQTHVKYVELKEMCARQCVREADLQNFINEHRIRGNLVIHKNSSWKPEGDDSNREHTHKDQRDGDGRSVMLEARVSGDAQTRVSSCSKRGPVEKAVVNKEYIDSYEDDEDCKDGDEFQYSTETPTKFTQIDRNEADEHALWTNTARAQKRTTDRSRLKRRVQTKKEQHQEQLVERIRLELPSLTQRYERVRAQPKTRSEGKTLAQTPCQQSLLGECPPGCGSHPSYLHKRTPPAAARAKKSVTTMTSRGSRSAIRPWM